MASWNSTVLIHRKLRDFLLERGFNDNEYYETPEIATSAYDSNLFPLTTSLLPEDALPEVPLERAQWARLRHRDLGTLRGRLGLRGHSPLVEIGHP